MTVRIAVVVVAAMAAACSAFPNLGRVDDPGMNALVGEWESREEEGTQRFRFRTDSTALWIMRMKGVQDTFAVRYRYNPNSSPGSLDLYGFDRGQLEGRTLYCIVDRTKDAASFRMDCQPGRDAEVRPKAFTSHVMTFRRVR